MSDMKVFYSLFLVFRFLLLHCWDIHVEHRREDWPHHNRHLCLMFASYFCFNMHYPVEHWSAFNSDISFIMDLCVYQTISHLRVLIPSVSLALSSIKVFLFHKSRERHQGWVQEEKSRSIPESSLASQTLLTMSGSSPPLLFQTVIKLYCVTHSTDVRCEREVINDVGFTRQFLKVRVLLLFRCFISEKCGNAAFLRTTLVSHSLTCDSVIPYCCCHGGKYFRFVE